MMKHRYFQYIAGERKGEVLLFDKIEEEDGIIFVTFKDGSRCNEELIAPLNEKHVDGKLMAEISDPNNVWKLKEEWVGRQEEKWETNKDGEKVCVQPFIKGRLKVTPIPPKPTKAKFGKIDESSKTPQKEQEQEQNNLNSNDPIWVMMNKAKKFDTNVPVELTISLPSKSLYNVAKESFENGGKKVIDYIISNLDDKKLKESLKIALFESYDDNETTIQEQETTNNSSQYINKKTNLGSSYEPEVVEEPVIGHPIIQKEKIEGPYDEPDID